MPIVIIVILKMVEEEQLSVEKKNPTRTDKPPKVDFDVDRLMDSASTNFQWQKAFSKGDQTFEKKKANVSLESDFTN